MFWATGILGVVLMAAPYILGYAENEPALWTSLFVGLATVTVSLLEGLQGDKERWEYWFAALSGVTATAAPFILGFSGETAALWTSLVGGAFLALFAGSRLTAGQWGKT